MTTVLLSVLAVIGVLLLVTAVVFVAVQLTNKLNELEVQIKVKELADDIVKDIKAQPGPYTPVRDISSIYPNPFVSYSSLSSESTLRSIKNRLENIEKETIDYDTEQTLLERVKKLEEDVMELNQFYYIPSDSNDVSLVDMVKDLQERCDTLYKMMADRIMDINELRYSINAAKADRRNSEYKIFVGDDPNQMQTGTTV